MSNRGVLRGVGRARLPLSATIPSKSFKDITTALSGDGGSQTPSYYDLVTATNNNYILPPGNFLALMVGGGGAGGGVPAGLTTYTQTQTAVAHSVVSGNWLQFNDCRLFLSNAYLANGMTVTGAGITGACGVGRISGNMVEIISFGGTVTGASLTNTAYVFSFLQAGAGGAACYANIQPIYSDGITPFGVIPGAGGVGVSGGTGGSGAITYLTGGPQAIATLSPPGVGGLAATPSQLAFGANPSGENPSGDTLARIAFYLPGGGGGHPNGPPSLQGVAAAENPTWGAVGGGAGGLPNGATNGGGGGQQGIISAGGAPGTTGGSGSVNGLVGSAALAPNYGCGGGGAGSNATAAGTAAAGGNGGPGCVLFWR